MCIGTWISIQIYNSSPCPLRRCRNSDIPIARRQWSLNTITLNKKPDVLREMTNSKSREEKIQNWARSISSCQKSMKNSEKDGGMSKGHRVNNGIILTTKINSIVLDYKPTDKISIHIDINDWMKEWVTNEREGTNFLAEEFLIIYIDIYELIHPRHKMKHSHPTPLKLGWK